MPISNLYLLTKWPLWYINNPLEKIVSYYLYLVYIDDGCIDKFILLLLFVTLILLLLPYTNVYFLFLLLFFYVYSRSIYLLEIE